MPGMLVGIIANQHLSHRVQGGSGKEAGSDGLGPGSRGGGGHGGRARQGRKAWSSQGSTKTRAKACHRVLDAGHRRQAKDGRENGVVVAGGILSALPRPPGATPEP